MSDAHILTNTGQEALDQFDLGGGPAIAVNGIVDDPDDARAVGPIQAHVDAVLDMAAEQRFVVGWGGLQLRVGVEVDGLDRLAVGQAPDPRDSFVHGVVEIEILAFPFPVALSAVEEPRVEDPDAVPGVPGTEHQAIALGAQHVIHEAGGRRPVDVIERGLVQRRHNPVKRVSFTHGSAFTCRD